MNLFAAHAQWASRPEDERFASLEDMHAVLAARRRASIDVPRVSLKDLRVRRLLDANALGVSHVNAQSDIAAFTHWSLGQWCARTGVPRDLLGRIDMDIAIDVMENRRLRYVSETDDTTTRALYGRNGFDILRAFHGSKYERLWDCEVTEALLYNLPEGWRNPVAYAKGKFGSELEPSGLYASDRDVWAFFVTGGDFTGGRDWNTVDVNGDVLQRGFFVWNSEVGKTSFGWASFWFRVVCGNHIVWGVEDYTETRAAHVSAVRTTFERGFVRFLEGLGKADTRDAFAALVREAQAEIAVEITGDRKETVAKAVDKLRAGRDRFTGSEVERAYDAVRSEEKGARGTRWDWLNGFTASARSIENADDRVELERRAARVLLGR